MKYKIDKMKLNTWSQRDSIIGRVLNPADINVPQGYQVEVFAEGLDTPTSILFTERGDVYIASSGHITGNPAVYVLRNGLFELLADKFNVPLTGINYRNGVIYVSHRGTITILNQDGSRQDIITGLPSYGDYSNCRVDFGSEGKLYFGQGTATNSGIVGVDNAWIWEHPYFHDIPGAYIILNGQNFASKNILIQDQEEIVYTGAYSPFGTPNLPFEVKKGVVKATGSILRANLDGSELELVAWGLRSPSYVKFDETDRLYVSNNGFDTRGSRPIANAPDEFHNIVPGVWYGWPDYAGGEPVTLSRFSMEGSRTPTEFLLRNHPNVPPKPLSIFPPGSTIIGFDFNYFESFGQYGDVYIAEFGSIRPRTITDVSPLFLGSGHRISRIDMITGGVSTFAINKTGFPASLTRGGGLDRPADIAFGPDGAMYIVDMGINTIENLNVFIPNTGVIWKISRITA